jgi:hypothetical protein|uniref:Uncharacterized protein n=2 Tax=unclassified Caudoviricetes TaxID=2788787 RepID=A0A8S5MR31_9CAUD|nr:MAG TPA: Protein of unknown function (DUF1366) [Siphoviridae sp. ctHSm42]DAD93137.1 MAG TPA: Protein of unknown function (DUF1366) [Siphoviridae sp. ctFxs15]
MEFKVISKYLQDSNRTFVAIRQESPYTAFDRVLVGDRTNDPDNVLIEAVLGLVATEFNPAEGVKQLQEDLKIQEQSYDKKLEEKDNAINAVKAIANWAVLARVTDVDNPLDPTVFKRGLELVDLAQNGKTYQPQEIFTIENPEHGELYQEGKRVMVQVNEAFTYQGQTLKELADLERNGKLGIWKWEPPKENAPTSSAELNTKAVPQ